MENEITTIFITQETKERIKKLALTQGESYNNILIRLIRKWGGAINE